MLIGRTTTLGSTVERPAMPVSYRRRRLLSVLGWAMFALCFVVLAAALVDILTLVVTRGIGSLNLTLFTKPTNGVSGGLLNAIEGTAVITFGSVLIAAPIGIGAGVYLSEYATGWLSRVARYLADVLVGVPSIVLGLFGYIVMVVYLGWHFSVLAGCITLAIMILPYITRTTELAMGSVSAALRESAYALGASDATVILRVLLPACRRSILTGVLVATALSMGETAPLIYTVGWSNYLWQGHLTHEPAAYLTYVIWSFINEPFASAHALAFAAALLVTVFALLITVAARLLIPRQEGH
ncbi:MAG: phosphate ABC transporter permease PstA [Gammaproteobacteria bacterium]